MDEREEEEFLKIIGSKGTVPILKFLNKKEAQYKDLIQSAARIYSMLFTALVYIIVCRI